MFLVFRQNPLPFACELIEALRFNNLAITCGMNVFSNFIKNLFAHNLAQFAVLSPISGVQNKLTREF